ncbi:MAG: hypothetical protein LBS81_03825 [Endomicrobium sp.]|jgi:hypothetical protein|nr:hypothetical protein [Endomicrobium sp.]
MKQREHDESIKQSSSQFLERAEYIIKFYTDKILESIECISKKIFM